MYTTKLDWLAFSWKAGPTFQEDEFDRFMDAFPEIKAYYDDCQYIRVCSPAKFYNCSLMFNENFMISWRVEALASRHGDRNLGVNVSIPAHGLEFFFELMGYDKDDCFYAFEDLRKRGCTFSRIDIAYDDYDKLIKPYDYGNWFIHRQLVTHFRKGHYIATSSEDGGTFYLGNRSSGSMIRIYDKAFESRQKDGSSLIDSIRYEIEVHGEHAEPYVDYMIENHAFPSLQSALSNYIDRVTTEGSNKTRDQRMTLPEWDLFIMTLTPPLTQSCDKKVKVTRKKDTCDKLLRKLRWYQGNVVPTLKTFALVFGWDAVLNSIMNSPICKDHDILMALYSQEHVRYDYAFDDGVALGKDFSTCW